MGTGEKCWLPAFSPFPIMFQKLPVSGLFKEKGLYDKGLKREKHGRISRKCWLPAFSPFPTMFSAAVILRFS